MLRKWLGGEGLGGGGSAGLLLPLLGLEEERHVVARRSSSARRMFGKRSGSRCSIRCTRSRAVSPQDLNGPSRARARTAPKSIFQPCQ